MEMTEFIRKPFVIGASEHVTDQVVEYLETEEANVAG